jgi:uncharacterized protein (DUF1015 family)
MARVVPFAALRPKPEYAAQVAALPYDVMSTEEARAMAEGNPYCFLHVDKAEIDLPPGIPFNDPSVYETARAHLQKLIAGEILMQDAKPCFYIYRLTKDDGSFPQRAAPPFSAGYAQTGLAACVYVEDYHNGLIKKHELTRPDKEQDRVNHILACGAHTGPIFMTYRDEAGGRDMMRAWTEAHPPVYDFVSDGNVRQQLWVVDEEAVIQTLTDTFNGVPCMYIADGHHRSAAAARAFAEAAHMRGTDKFLAVLFPHDELAILDYNRLVTDLNGCTREGFLKALERDFNVTLSQTPVRPSRTHEYGLYMDGGWRRLTLKSEPPADLVDGLAVSVLQDYLLSPVLGIHDPRTDNRIDFVGGIRGTGGLTARVDSGEMEAAFTLCPTTLEELLAVADAGRIMPPKSTWFEPKLLSGLLIHRFGQ